MTQENDGLAWLQHMDGIIVKHTSNCLNLLPAGTSFFSF